MAPLLMMTCLWAIHLPLAHALLLGSFERCLIYFG